MLRSLYSGISGLRAHQTMLDVTGANIANVNTAGFKSSTVQFQDTLSQMTQGASAPQTQTGGSNPAQVGLGVKIASITTNFSQGSSQSTGRATDMMISGEGFFVTSKSGQQLFSRAGSFTFDAANHLVSPDGAVLQGWTAVSGAVNTSGTVGDITLKSNDLIAKITEKVTLDGNLPSDAVEGTADGTVDRVVKVYDATGADRMVSLTFTKIANSQNWQVDATDENGATGTGTLTFAGGQQTAGSAGTVTVGGISVDLSAVSGYAKAESLTVTGQDGYAAGSLESYTIGSDGSVLGAFSNGAKQVLAKIAMAKFTNPAGLEKAGGSSYVATGNSGGVQLGSAGDPGMGSLSGGNLEMSNVDLSQEFTNLIVAQRGFQANARIITTSDEILQELTQLKR
ncbi:flagellar hook protein FlgE [Arthrobacter sp. PAMC25284]|uniref:flagellar hook protein FlgE n=1 Tax=Arthrobacter sp. PAMC25284 TaxID=2861279 RepID=UPI001C635D5B|nr:flagellar hook protein FlgE [Arthrobacter sp. PAMC25284]QYF91255.1 flagellar hook protein FlgE [Arthrobacter sp. PAMC25284]